MLGNQMIFISMEEQYRKLITDHILISLDDLSDDEKAIINYSWSIIKNKLADLKIAEDEIKRLNIELINLKSMFLDKDEE